jgi:uncharacterized protein
MAVLRTSTSFKDSYVIVAFPGLGFIGTIAGRYIVEKADLKWTGYLFTENLPPIGKVMDGNLIYPINIFSGDGFHVVLSEVSPSEEDAWSIANAISSKARKDGAKGIIIISGVISKEKSDVYAIYSSKRSRKLLEGYNIPEIKNGVITGISATLLLSSKEMGVPALLLLGPATNRQDFQDAISVIRFLSGFLGVNIPLEELEELAHRYETEIKLLQRKMEMPDSPMYG